MPLNKKGKKIRNAFIREYGKQRGINIFYAWEHTHPWALKEEEK